MSEARYLIYSLTKTFVATIFCRLADRGELSLEDPLSTWVDDPRVPDASLREVLNHTAGIPDYADAAYAEAVRERPAQPWSDEELLKHALARPAPRQWTYSNSGYLILRSILDRIASGGFAGALAREITGPLQLSQTTLALELQDLEGLAPGTSTQIGPGSQDVRGRYHPRWVGHRTAISTESDLRRFWTALAGGRLLGDSFDDLRAMVDVGVDAYDFVRPSYGLGVMGDPEWPHGVLIGHGGGGPGYGAAAFALVRPEPLVAIVLQGEDGDGSAESAAIRQLEIQVTESAP